MKDSNDRGRSEDLARKTQGVVAWAARELRERPPISLPTAADLPWRKEKTPYRVFVAEFLLVRTRSDVVARIFEGFVARYPNLRSLAEANEANLATALKPLGLSKRVPFLPKAARYLLERHEGRIPEGTKELESVPGVGPYTAAAVAAFAYDNPAEVPADVNVLRFLSRLTGLPMTHPTKGSKDLRSLLPLLSKKAGGPRFETLLDFSRLICRPGRPKFSECPLRDRCIYHRSAAAPPEDESAS